MHAHMCRRTRTHTDTHSHSHRHSHTGALCTLLYKQQHGQNCITFWGATLWSVPSFRLGKFDSSLLSPPACNFLRGAQFSFLLWSIANELLHVTFSMTYFLGFRYLVNETNPFIFLQQFSDLDVLSIQASLLSIVYTWISCQSLFSSR